MAPVTQKINKWKWHEGADWNTFNNYTANATRFGFFPPNINFSGPFFGFFFFLNLNILWWLSGVMVAGRKSPPTKENSCFSTQHWHNMYHQHWDVRWCLQSLPVNKNWKNIYIWCARPRLNHEEESKMRAYVYAFVKKQTRKNKKNAHNSRFASPPEVILCCLSVVRVHSCCWDLVVVKKNQTTKNENNTINDTEKGENILCRACAPTFWMNGFSAGWNYFYRLHFIFLFHPFISLT